MTDVAQRGRSYWSDAWRKLRRNRTAMACLFVVGFFSLIAIYGQARAWYYDAEDITAPYNVVDLEQQYLPPSFEHPMGTDNLGRDVLQRVIQGTTVAFQVGIITSLIAIPLGLFFGLIAGYFGGRVDDVIVWLYSTFASMPSLLFILALSLVVGKGLIGVFIGVGLTAWVNLCRLVRGEVMKHKDRAYVQAAQTLGIGHGRILFRHILPNVLHLVIITFSLRFPAAIGTEVIVSFLGIGVQGEPSWGVMISNARLRLWEGIWWEMTFVTLAIFAIVLAFNLLGDALRDALDPKLAKQR